MKERLITLALALGALAFFYAMMAPKPQPESEKITTPLTTERGPNGYAAMIRWLTSESIPVVSFRERYSRLPNASSGNVLITTMPHRLAARVSEIDSLQDWVYDGNTLVVMAALADTPDWAMQPEYRGQLIEQLKELTGLEFAVAKPQKDDDENEARPEKAPESLPEQDMRPNKQSDKRSGGHPRLRVLSMPPRDCGNPSVASWCLSAIIPYYRT